MEKHLNDSKLQSLYNYKTEGEYLFIQRWREIFNNRTIDAYRNRIKNTHSILVELLMIIDKTKKGIIQENHIETIKNECLRKLSNDETFKKHNLQFHKTLCKNISNHSSRKRGGLYNLECEIKATLNNVLEPNYLRWLLEDLKDSIDNNELDKENKLIESLASELVFRGWTSSSLYRLGKEIFLNEKKDFSDRWEEFIEVISSEEKIFHCFFEVNKGDVTEKVKIVTASKILEKDYENTSNFIVKKSNNESRYIHIEESAFPEDLNRAMEKAEEKIMDIESLYLYYGEEIDIKKDRVLVVLTNNKMTSYNFYQNNLRNYFRLATVNIEGIQNFEKVIHNNSIHSETRNRLYNVLNQYKLGLESQSIETWYTSFWIALESLVVTGQYENIIDHILKVVPPVICLKHVKKIIENLCGDFGRAGVNLNRYDIDTRNPQERDMKNLLDILKDKDKLSELISNIDDYTLLKIRCKNIVKELHDNKSLLKTLKNHHENVSWHLQRLYRIRNSFVHNATIDEDLLPITMHLHYYLRTVMSEIILGLNTGIFQGIGELYAYIEDYYDSFLGQLSDGESRSIYEILISNYYKVE